MGQQVTCIKKSGSGLEHITTIGVASGVKYTVTQAIALIRADAKALYTASSIIGPFLRIASRNGVEYVSTTPDGTTTDNLLSLPECP